MSGTFYRTPREAAALIRPVTIKTVRLLFQARSNHVALIKVPKTSTLRMLGQLPENAVVAIDIMTGLCEATIAGIIEPTRGGELSEAAAVARRMS